MNYYTYKSIIYKKKEAKKLPVSFYFFRNQITKVVTNPSGGILSKGHSLGATDLAQCLAIEGAVGNPFKYKMDMGENLGCVLHGE